MSSREYDIILLGATGFTGRFAAFHLSETSMGVKWAIAGRSKTKLTQLANDLRNNRKIEPDVVPVEFTKEGLGELAKRTRCLIATVGPFPMHGVLPFEACAENGTHYVDVNGEPPSILEMIRKYDEIAKSNGAIMIPSCGIGSLPADLLTFLMVEKVRDIFKTPTSGALISMHESRAQASGGTLNGLVTGISSYGLRKMIEAGRPWVLSPIQPTDAQGSPVKKVSKDTIERLGLGTLGFGTTATHDKALVQRTWGLLQQAENNGIELLSYGPNFNFKSVQRYPSRIHGWAFYLLVWTLTILPAVFPPFRWLVRLIAPPGSGPTEEERKKNFVEYRGVAIADLDDGTSDSHKSGEKQSGVHAKMRYEGDSYVFTGVMAAEAAMTILDSQNETFAHKLRGGVLTPAMLGRPLAERLAAAGTILEIQPL